MVLRELGHDAVTLGLVAGIEAEVRAAFRLGVQFLERRHASLKEQVASQFVFLGRAPALRLVPCIDFLHIRKLEFFPPIKKFPANGGERFIAKCND